MAMWLDSGTVSLLRNENERTGSSDRGSCSCLDLAHGHCVRIGGDHSKVDLAIHSDTSSNRHRTFAAAFAWSRRHSRDAIGALCCDYIHSGGRSTSIAYNFSIVSYSKLLCVFAGRRCSDETATKS